MASQSLSCGRFLQFLMVRLRCLVTKPFIKISSLIVIWRTTEVCYYVYCCHRNDDVTVGVPVAYNWSSSTWSTVLLNNSSSISPSINYYHRLILAFLSAARPRTLGIYDFVVVMNLLTFLDKFSFRKTLQTFAAGLYYEDSVSFLLSWYYTLSSLFCPHLEWEVPPSYITSTTYQHRQYQTPQSSLATLRKKIVNGS